MGRGSETEEDCVRLKVGSRRLEVRRAPSFPGSGFVGFAELYLDGRYEGYLAIPKEGGPNVVIYGRSQLPRARAPLGEAAGDKEISPALERVQPTVSAPGAGSLPMPRHRVVESVKRMLRRRRWLPRRRQGEP